MSPMSEIHSISSTSTTAQRRKIKKPLIEKRRRLRINQSLANLKSLVLEATQKDENCFPKMEKADILEMTVAYMKTTRHRLPSVASSGPAAQLQPGGGGDDDDDQLRTYLSGFQECAVQVCSFLMDESTGEVGGGGGADRRGQLTQHLSGCFRRMELDFKSRKDRQAAVASFGSNPNDESAKDRTRIRCDDRLCPLLLTSSSDNKSVQRSLTSTLSPLTSAAAAAAASNYKAEMPRIAGVCSTSHFPTLHSSIVQDSHSRNSAGAELASCHSSTIRKSNSAVPPNNYPSSLIMQQQQQQQQQQHQQHCRSPQKGDDFPLNFASRSSPISNAAEPTLRYSLNPSYRFYREPMGLQAVDCSNSSVIWRPW